MKKNMLILIGFILGMLPMQAQVTQGGTTQNWERFSVVYDTIITHKQVASAYPSSGNFYFKFSINSLKGEVAQESDFLFPENGFRGTGGSDFKKAYDIAFGRYKNFKNINKNLHPAVDFSGNFELGFRIGQPEYDPKIPIDYYELDYGIYFDVFYGWGPMATFKPGYLSSSSPDLLKELYIDVGLRPEIALYTRMETNYSFDNGYDEIEGYIYSDNPGLVLNNTIFIGFRWKFIGLRFDFTNQLTSLLKAKYYSSYTIIENNGSYNYDNYSETISSDIKYNMNKFCFLLYF